MACTYPETKYFEHISSLKLYPKVSYIRIT